MKALLDGIEHVVVMGQCVEEAEFTDSAAMIDLIRPAIRECRVCGRDTYVTRPTLDAVGCRIYVSCLGCVDKAVERAGVIDSAEIANAKTIAEFYRRALAQKIEEMANGGR